MRCIVFGTGSIGTRHIENLISLGIEVEAISYRADKTFIKKYKNINVKINTIEEKLNFSKFDFVIIANETHLHIKTALMALKNGCHVFIEKPLSLDKKGIFKLKKLSKETKKIVKVGFMLRYHPNLKFIKNFINHNNLGKILYIKATVGQNLSQWRTNYDFKKGYSINKKKGGGVIFDLCHEFDYLSWFLGKFNNIFAFNQKIGFISDNVESISHIIFTTINNISGTITLDYVKPFLERSLEIVGTQGVLRWNEIEGKVITSTNGIVWNIIHKVKKDFSRNNLYYEEINDFIKKINKKDYFSDNDLILGIENLNTCLFSHLSAEKKKLISI